MEDLKNPVKVIWFLDPSRKAFYLTIFEETISTEPISNHTFVHRESKKMEQDTVQIRSYPTSRSLRRGNYILLNLKSVLFKLPL